MPFISFLVTIWANNNSFAIPHTHTHTHTKLLHCAPWLSDEIVLWYVWIERRWGKNNKRRISTLITLSLGVRHAHTHTHTHTHTCTQHPTLLRLLQFKGELISCWNLCVCRCEYLWFCIYHRSIKERDAEPKDGTSSIQNRRFLAPGFRLDYVAKINVGNVFLCILGMLKPLISLCWIFMLQFSI